MQQCSDLQKFVSSYLFRSDLCATRSQKLIRRFHELSMTKIVLSYAAKSKCENRTRTKSIYFRYPHDRCNFIFTFTTMRLIVSKGDFVPFDVCSARFVTIKDKRRSANKSLCVAVFDSFQFSLLDRLWSFDFWKIIQQFNVALIFLLAFIGI